MCEYQSVAQPLQEHLHGLLAARLTERMSYQQLQLAARSDHSGDMLLMILEPVSFISQCFEHERLLALFL